MSRQKLKRSFEPPLTPKCVTTSHLQYLPAAAGHFGIRKVTWDAPRILSLLTTFGKAIVKPTPGNNSGTTE